jgi:post-segregation antitoxin (ccd killing protein)
VRVVSTWVRVSTFDELAKYALKHGVSMSALVRGTLSRAVTPHKTHEPR